MGGQEGAYNGGEMRASNYELAVGRVISRVMARSERIANNDKAAEMDAQFDHGEWSTAWHSDRYDKLEKEIVAAVASHYGLSYEDGYNAWVEYYNSNRWSATMQGMNYDWCKLVGRPGNKDAWWGCMP